MRFPISEIETRAQGLEMMKSDGEDRSADREPRPFKPASPWATEQVGEAFYLRQRPRMYFRKAESWQIDVAGEV